MNVLEIGIRASRWTSPIFLQEGQLAFLPLIQDRGLSFLLDITPYFLVEGLLSILLDVGPRDECPCSLLMIIFFFPFHFTFNLFTWFRECHHIFGSPKSYYLFTHKGQLSMVGVISIFIIFSFMLFLSQWYYPSFSSSILSKALLLYDTFHFNFF